MYYHIKYFKDNTTNVQQLVIVETTEPLESNEWSLLVNHYTEPGLTGLYYKVSDVVTLIYEEKTYHIELDAVTITNIFDEGTWQNDYIKCVTKDGGVLRIKTNAIKCIGKINEL